MFEITFQKPPNLVTDLIQNNEVHIIKISFRLFSVTIGDKRAHLLLATA